ncbi:DNA glycosylase [Cercophora scortea]|uniref:Adenine DNA glycosylase n=1 Tax=Cercophora scortea TaxID=314031 RepID=A0AAE0I8X7_9PEZI|nr:DNA glycosylase [Cercophora scortea]
MTTRRQSSRIAAKAQPIEKISRKRTASKVQKTTTGSDDGSTFGDDDEDVPEPSDPEIVDEDDESEDAAQSRPPPSKKRRTTTSSKHSAASKNILTRQICSRLFPTLSPSPTLPLPTTSLRQTSHALPYHRPLLLQSLSSRQALLSWFDSVSTARSMPWRKAWIDPSTSPSPSALHAALARRAYEVWISEIMLQQTRVAVVIDYWNRWVSKWPTIEALAAASADDVLAAWRGLGYYSRASRIHAGAKLVCDDPDMRGMLPASVAELVDKVPGVGRYTAGAISAIVFGRAAPMVDGNVLRVLSRQMGVLGDVKTDKRVIDVLWEAAGALVETVARDGEEGEGGVSDRPGRWGQALMELGSTVCTPKPSCGLCPVTSTCRAYGEGYALGVEKGVVDGVVGVPARLPDIEDLCTLCEPMEEDTDNAEPAEKSKPVSKRQQKTISSFFGPGPPARKKPADPAPLTPRALDIIANHAKQFPLKKPKKKVREEECIVCAVRRASDGRYLITRRPDKGLLAGMWEFPSHTLPEQLNGKTSAPARKSKAVAFVSGLASAEVGRKGVKHAGELGSVPWLFSHLKLTMHVHLFTLHDDGEGDVEMALADAGIKTTGQRWASGEDVEQESMGTGMRKCWALVNDV